MSGIGKDTIAILQFLLPGFLSAWIYYGLTPYSKPSEFERVVQALIFTLIIQAFVSTEDFVSVAWLHLWTPQAWDLYAQISAPTVTAGVVGLIFSAGANNDKFHALARRLGVTKETSYPSEWFGAFATNVTFVVLTLNDERRLYGWPIDWPSDPNEGHFVLRDVSWLVENGENGQQEITGISSMMVRAKDVKWVEFLDKTWENNP